MPEGSASMPRRRPGTKCYAEAQVLPTPPPLDPGPAHSLTRTGHPSGQSFA